jgi:hypothetical protein
MDTAYYAVGAIRLAAGNGASEPFVWNYLDDPAGIPNPSFLYWMPLPSLLAAPFVALFPGSFFAQQIPFVLLSSTLPALAYLISSEIGGKQSTARLAGLFMLFSGLFFPYWTLPETFTPFAVAGSLALWLCGRSKPRQGLRVTLQRVGVGLLAGLTHLSRSDGPLVLGTILVAPILAPLLNKRRRPDVEVQDEPTRWEFGLRDLLLVLAGYAIAMGPWFLRNLALTGSAMPSAGTKTLWLRNYDDLFCYDCELSLRSYLDWGWANIANSKLWALDINLRRFLAENCLIFLFPFVLLGLYRLRRHPPVALTSIFLLFAYAAHSLAFTFPGPRGGFFHASTAALPLLFAAGAEGLEAALQWAARKRRWNLPQARTVFLPAAVLIAILLSLWTAYGKVAQSHTADEGYREAGEWLEEHLVPRTTPVMVGNPPGLWYHTRWPAYVVPNGDVATLLQVCDRYEIEYVILDQNRPTPLSGLYDGEVLPPSLVLVAELDGGRVKVFHRLAQDWTESAGTLGSIPLRHRENRSPRIWRGHG